jgi:hypothetical protein
MTVGILFYILAYIQHNGHVSLEKKKQRMKIHYGNKQNEHFVM